MSAQTRTHEQKSLKTLEGVNCVLDLFTDHLTIRRTDPLANYLPDMFSEVRTVDLNDITAVYLHESRYIYSRWVMLVLQLTNHKHITLLYSRKDQPQAEAIKSLIDEAINRRPFFPPATVS